MMRLLTVAGLGLAMTCGAQAQDEATPSPDRDGNVGADFANSPAARLAFVPAADLAAPQGTTSSAMRVSRSALFTLRPASSLLSGAALPGSSPEPAATPQPIPGRPEDLPLQLALGISVIRFRSSFYYATAVGTSTSLTYFTHQSFGWEGSIVTAFAPTIYANEHVKYFSYGAGPKLAWRRRLLQPWIHGIVGGAHIIPQVADQSHNGFEFEVGGGTDYFINPRISVRLELDWVRSRLFGQWQNSAQAALDGVLHF